jgi:putative glutamine amidotransferase
VTRPVVGITLGDDDRQAGLLELREAYVRSVERAGAIPVALPAGSPADAAGLLERLDGILLSGGIDVDPPLFGESAHSGLRRVDRRRDDFEIALVRGAIERDVPILAICRGHQVLNVATGGTLHQDLPSLIPGGERHERAEPRWQRVHTVAIEPRSRLSSLLGEGPVSVNSIHHQAVARVGTGLVVSARCPDDDVVEGIEMPARRFVLGVQWHPEAFWHLSDSDSFQCLFDAHADACRTAALAGRP